MTRSKIQKMKFFLFLLIFLLAQAAVSEGSFREKKDEPTVGSKGKVENTGGKVDEQPVTALSPGKNGQQAVAAASANSRTRPAADTSNRTHNITSKPSAPDVAAAANKTAHAADATDEVCFIDSFNCTAKITIV